MFLFYLVKMRKNLTNVHNDQYQNQLAISDNCQARMQIKKRSEAMQTLRAGCSKADPQTNTDRGDYNNTQLPMQQNAYWIFHLSYFHVPTLPHRCRYMMLTIWSRLIAAWSGCSSRSSRRPLTSGVNGCTHAWKLMDDTLSTCCDSECLTSVFIFLHCAVEYPICILLHR